MMRATLCALTLVSLIGIGRVVRAEDGSPAQTVEAAVRKLEFGDYEGVTQLLQPLVDSGATNVIFRQERIEALRAYGIACAMTRRRASAEGALAMLLSEEPNIRFDPNLVRPEAVELLESVRARVLDVSAKPRRRYSAEMVAGISLVSLGGLFGVVGLGMDAAILHSDSNPAFPGATTTNAQYFAIATVGTSIVCTGVGIALVIHAAPRR